MTLIPLSIAWPRIVSTVEYGVFSEPISPAPNPNTPTCRPVVPKDRISTRLFLTGTGRQAISRAKRVRLAPAEDAERVGIIWRGRINEAGTRVGNAGGKPIFVKLRGLEAATENYVVHVFLFDVAQRQVRSAGREMNIVGIGMKSHGVEHVHNPDVFCLLCPNPESCVLRSLACRGTFLEDK